MVKAAPFKAMLLAVTFKVLKLVVPTAPFKRTLPLIPEELMFKLLDAAVSPAMVLATAIMALAAEAVRLVLAPNVMGPV